MTSQVLPSILLVISTVHAFQYTELAQYIDSHQEEYVEVQHIVLIPLAIRLRAPALRVQAPEMLKSSCFYPD